MRRGARRIEWRRVGVEAYAGVRADERPMFIIDGGRRKTVKKLLSARIEQDVKTGWRRRVFEVELEGGDAAVVRHDEEDDSWWILET